MRDGPWRYERHADKSHEWRRSIAFERLLMITTRKSMRREEVSFRVRRDEKDFNTSYSLSISPSVDCVILRWWRRLVRAGPPARLPSQWELRASVSFTRDLFRRDSFAAYLQRRSSAYTVNLSENFSNVRYLDFVTYKNVTGAWRLKVFNEAFRSSSYEFTKFSIPHWRPVTSMGWHI